MPFFFAGRLESGNVCEYFRMKRYFNEIGITKHDVVLHEMGIKEKEHEEYFRNKVKDSRLLPFFQHIFSWGAIKSFNDVDLSKPLPPDKSARYCKNHR